MSEHHGMSTDQTPNEVEAIQRLKQARERGETELSLADLPLERLPEEIKDLTALQSLNLRGWKQLQDLRPLAALTALRRLTLNHCEAIQDLQPLSGLTGLHSLHLHNCLRLQNLKPLAGLTALRYLDLSECAQVADLLSLSGMAALQHLELFGCDRVVDLRPLAGLTALRTLYLDFCRQLSNLEPLADLITLRELSLSRCEQLKDLQPLSSLVALQKLDLRRCLQIRDLRPLAGLTGLQDLELSECEQVQDIQPLAALSELIAVKMFDCTFLNCLPGAQPLASWRKLEQLYVNQIEGAPRELSAKSYEDNALPRIQAWQQDLLVGEAANSSVKLFFLGNGGVGKTQICRRLRGEGFDECVPSTHGVSIGEVRLAAATNKTPAVDAVFWDFGGQDVYLGTHALFLDERAIYVIAWTPAQENADEYEQCGVPMRNRPLSYWLEYVRWLAGEAAPVIVLQTQCDRESDARPPSLPAGHGFERLRVTSSSARQEDGIEQLQLELKRAARYQLEQFGKIRLPSSWVAVRDELRQRTAERTLPRAAFDALCAASHARALPAVVLEYLHRSGHLFWREGLFQNHIVLDQAWALSGVYAILERTFLLPEIRRRGGIFSPQLLSALAWRDRSEEEQRFFLSLMEQCQVCFKVTDDLYVAPALLPPLSSMEEHVQHLWREATPDAKVRLDYAFLHEGIFRALLCGIGKRAGPHAVYWAYGVCFYDTAHRSIARISSVLPDATIGETNGCVIVEAAGPDAEALATHLVASIEELPIGRAPQVRWELGHTDGPEHGPLLFSSVGHVAFAQIQPAQPQLAVDERRPVYVSYAWGGESEGVVDELERRLPFEGFRLLRDKNEMRPGDWISRFMMEIGRAERVLVVISDKYLRSIYCMRELLYLFNSSLGDRNLMSDRMVPLVVGNLNFTRFRDRAPYVSYWADEHAQLDELVKQHVGGLDPAGREEWLAVGEFYHRVSDLLAWVGDTLIPRGPQGIDAAIQLLHRRS